MPVRIYDISEKLGLEHKQVLTKAKELGIVGARVASSSLDKITAEYLEDKLREALSSGEIPRYTPQPAQTPAPPPPPENALSRALGLRDSPAPTAPPKPSPPPAISTAAEHPAPTAQPAAPPSPPQIRFTSSFVLDQILKRLGNGAPYSARSFERDVTRLLTDLFPFSVLSGVRLFSSEPRGRIDFGFEMDNLLHLRLGEIDHIVIVEVKNQSVIPEKGRWSVQYDGSTSCAREQVDNHIRTMWEYLRPIARQVELRFCALVVSSDLKTPQRRADGYRNAELHLCSVEALPRVLSERFNFTHAPNLPLPEVLRVPQSGFLDLLRLGLPVQQLGHPELASAIRYVDRCRRTLDETLFQKFDPTPGHWAINGSAGMGKSVLLAYAAAVLSSGYELYRALGVVGVKKATDTFKKIGFDPDPKRGSIALMAMSAKQLDNIRGWFSLFTEQFQQADTAGDVRFRPPEFILCRPGTSLATLGERCSALLVDEAHDLPPFAARDLVQLYNKGGLYLVVACDRHQKLRLAGSDAKIIEGLDFTNRSTRLRQIYRNPAPVYIASLALMFRWFAESGPKVIPTVTQMDDHFGFQTTTTAEGLDVLMRTDAHPANSWCHTVATFPDAAAAFAALMKEKLGHREVLWVRFAEEDPDFDYEQLIQHFTYHNCCGLDAHTISDKYIKGQDYPIVVIEGFPSAMDSFEASTGVTPDAAEARAWTLRRELYLCASRATAFLYFVYNVPETPEVLRITAEVQRLVAATATPENPNSGGTRRWQFRIRRTTQTRKPEVFADAVAACLQEPTPAPPQPLVAPVAVPGSAPIIQSAPAAAPTSQPATVASASQPAQQTAQLTPTPAPSVPQPSAAPVSAITSPPPDSGAPAKPTQASSAPLSQPAPQQPQPSLAKPAPTPIPSGTTPFPPPLDPAASLLDVAKYTGKDISELVHRLRNAGFPNIQPSSTVSVSYVLTLLSRPLPPQPPAPSKPAPPLHPGDPKLQTAAFAQPPSTPAPAPQLLPPKPAQPKGWQAKLGKTARVSDIAAYAHRATAELVLRLRDAGHSDAQDSSLVDVAFVFQLLTKPLPPQPPLISPNQHPAPPAAASPDTSSAPKPVSEAKTILNVPYRATLQQVAALLGVKPPELAAELLAMKIVCSLHQPVPPGPLLRICHGRGYTVCTTAPSRSSA